MAVALFASCLVADAGERLYDIRLDKRHLYGPGPFPDQALAVGAVRSMKLEGFLTMNVAAFNNGAAEPNVTGEAAQGASIDGKFSDGTLINEHIEMGNAVIANRQFNLVLGVMYGGPNRGESHFFLDPDFNWTIRDDIAMDPGFAEGIIKVPDFFFSTGPRPVPYSIQTERKFPGGMDRVGTLQSGDVVAGRLGDDDLDGRIDGVFFAMGQFPLNAPFLPGAPFVQRMEFTSDIPVSIAQAAFLTAATARNCSAVLAAPAESVKVERSKKVLLDCVKERTAVAMKHLQRLAQNRDECGQRCQEYEGLRSGLAAMVRDWRPAQSETQRQQILNEVVAALKPADTETKPGAPAAVVADR
ncbi:MAG TPA: hypothetical protein VFU13_03255 [Steroidobacteraceae bacterium]|nr:hypothetical protein [Steroidobacteraceae bacterium]